MSNEAKQVVLDAIGYRIMECCASCVHFAAMDYRGRNAVPIRIRLKGACCNPSVLEAAAPIVAPNEVTAIDVHGSGSCERWEADPQAVAVANPRAAVHTQPPLMPTKTADELREELRAKMQAAPTRLEPQPQRPRLNRPDRQACAACGQWKASLGSDLCPRCVSDVMRQP
jgi:hypothetical protein